jgi:hypothetical protein
MTINILNLLINLQPSHGEGSQVQSLSRLPPRYYLRQSGGWHRKPVAAPGPRAAIRITTA